MKWKGESLLLVKVHFLIIKVRMFVLDGLETLRISCDFKAFEHDQN